MITKQRFAALELTLLSGMNIPVKWLKGKNVTAKGGAWQSNANSNLIQIVLRYIQFNRFLGIFHQLDKGMLFL
jgi:hypothetical protein